MSAKKTTKKRPVKPAKPAVYKGKSTKPGGGGSFQMVVDALVKKGIPKARAQAIAAAQGRAKFGVKKFNMFAKKGKARAAKK